MNPEAIILPVPETFSSFPYTPPYPIQVDLMRHVYAAIEDLDQKVAIVESPTGTGKTLSLLCSTLTWLADDKVRSQRGELKAFQDAMQLHDEPDWVLEQTLERHKRELAAEELELEHRLENARKEAALLKMAHARVRKKQKVSHSLSEEQDEDTFFPASETEDGVLPTVEVHMKSLTKAPSKNAVKEPSCTKVFYASRTHSQLAQLRSELLKTTYTSARMVPLASRKNLCINEDLRAKVDSSTALDEGCRELLNEKWGKRCPYLPPPEEEHKMLGLQDHILATPKDIEDIVTIGKELHMCPYFGSRRAIPQAQLVTLPYNLLLQKSAREALGIDLNNHVVVVDEAHNLIDTLLAVHTVSLSSRTLDASLQQLTIYLNRFRKRLSPSHGLHLRRLLRFLNALKGFLDKWMATAKTGRPHASKQEILAASSLMTLLGNQVDGVNLLEIEAYLKRSKIARKISGYSDQLSSRDTPSSQTSRIGRHTIPPLHAVEDLILALSQNDADGRLTLTMNSEAGRDSVTLKYLLLNPSNCFKEIVDAARCVVLAGGTMSPIEDFKLQLFPFLTERQLSIFSCGHVIPSTNLQTLVISKGPRGGELQFTYGQRDNKHTLKELGQVLMNLVNLVPHGMVVFFPSYNFLNTVMTAFQEDGLLDKLNLKKPVFFEPEDTDVDTVLRQYTRVISSSSAITKKKGGAVLFAVVGAKLSEGINFSDSLARAVVIIGLPFASLASIELKERMRYATELEKSLGILRQPGSKDAGTELYENLCMRSVNQSIGRAIRHRNDYASLILVDTRYASPRISAKLPKWIGQSVTVTENFGHAVKELAVFFRTKS